MNTNIAVFTNACSEFVVSSVLAPLSQWLAQNKNVQVSVEEMAQVLQLPAQPKPVQQQQPLAPLNTGHPQPANFPLQMPPFLNGGIVGATTTGGRGGNNNRAKPVDVNYNGPRCQYKFARGAKSGQLCNDPCVEGSNFCKQCIKKKSGGGAGAPAPGMPALGGRGAFPNLGFTMPGMPGVQQGVQQQQQQPPQDNELEVVPIQGQDGYYREANYGFIVTQPENDIIVHGIEKEGQVRKLTLQEQQIATQLGMVVGPEAVDANQVQQPQIQQVPIQQPQIQQVPTALPTIPTLGNIPQQPQTPGQPTIPNLGNLGIPTVQGAQVQIPTIPTLGGLGTPKANTGMPTIPTIPTLGGIPKLQ